MVRCKAGFDLPVNWQGTWVHGRSNRLKEVYKLAVEVGRDEASIGVENQSDCLLYTTDAADERVNNIRHG